MDASFARATAPQVVVEHVSSFGPVVTHVRGSLLVVSLENLRAVGVADRYEALLPKDMRDTVLYTLASSWVPIEVALAHYRACDQLELTPSQWTQVGELTANRIIDTFLGRAVRISRNAGAETYWAMLKQIPRFYDRVYQGGGCTIMKTGPKDVLSEMTGQPLVEFRYWRNAYLAYSEALGNTFTKASFVKLARPRVYHAQTITVASSWV